MPHPLFHRKLEAAGFGVFVPFFFDTDRNLVFDPARRVTPVTFDSTDRTGTGGSVVGNTVGRPTTAKGPQPNLH